MATQTDHPVFKNPKPMTYSGYVRIQKAGNTWASVRWADVSVQVFDENRNPVYSLDGIGSEDSTSPLLIPGRDAPDKFRSKYELPLHRNPPKHNAVHGRITNTTLLSRAFSERGTTIYEKIDIFTRI